MKLTYEVPQIILDNTITETLYELLTKASSSLSVSGSFLVSDGDNHFIIKPISQITSSLVHGVKAISPLAVSNIDPIRPELYLNGIVSIAKGGTGRNNVQNEKFLIGRTGEYTFININGGTGISVSLGENLVINNDLYTTIQNKNTFFAGGEVNNSTPVFRKIIDADLPLILNNKQLINSTLSGSTSGSHKGTFQGSFSGDGSLLTGINIDGFTGELSVGNGGTGKTNFPFNSILVGNDSDPIKTFKGDSSKDEYSLVWDHSLNSFLLKPRATLENNTFNGNQTINGDITASFFNGNGIFLTGLSGSSFNNFKLDVLSQISGSGSVVINSDGVIYSDGGSGGISEVSSSGNITGSGLEDNPLVLKQDIQLNSVTASFSGDGTNLSNVPATIFFGSSYEAISVGDIVSIGPSGLAKCQKTDNLLSNGFGVVQYSGSDGIYVQTTSQATISIVGAYSTGSLLYVGNNGTACSYDQILSGEYITQIGVATGNGVGKILVWPRIFGQK